MIRLFDLRDILLIRELQRSRETIDSARAFLGEHQSLRLALLSYLFGYRSTVCTCVLDARGRPRSEAGYAQVRQRPGCPEWDIEYLAPALDVTARAPATWDRLLTGLCLLAAERGVVRLYARPLRGELAEEVLGRSGFSVYARETVFSLGTPSGVVSHERGRWRPMRENDEDAMRRLYAKVTPHLVRQAEGGDARSQGSLLPGEFKLCSGEWYICERDGSLEGCLGVRDGRKGYWVHLLLGEAEGCDAGGLVEEGLALLAGRPLLPVYCGVREYQQSVGRALAERGFEAVGARSLMVKHTTAKVKVGTLKLVRSLENGVNATTGVSPGVKSGIRCDGEVRLGVDSSSR